MVDDITLRFGLVFDSRDDEVAANSGILAYATHAIAKASIAGDLDYTRTTAAIQAYRQVTENLVITGRFMGQGMGGSPRTGSRSSDSRENTAPGRRARDDRGRKN